MFKIWAKIHVEVYKMHITNGNNEKNMFSKKGGVGKWFSKNGYYVLLVACFGVIAATAVWSLTGSDETDLSLTQQPKQSDLSIYVPSATPKASPSKDANVNAEPTKQPETSQGKPSTATSTFIMPITGTLAQKYSMDALVFSDTLNQWQVHNGIDLAADDGTDVLAAASGTVVASASDTMMGYTVVIDHGNGLKSEYSSLKNANVVVGDTVAKGEIIGQIGNTAITESKVGPHLHFAAMYNDEYVDPSVYLPGGSK